jgi:tRNA modification GTPase
MGWRKGTNYDMIKREMGDMMVNDTIYAPAAPSGGAIAVVRISGPAAHEILWRVFRSAAELKHAVMRHGGVYRNGVQVDDVMAVVFDEPRSYTGENMAEIYCHGGAVSLSGVLAAIAESGARLAEPGEFTKRAFLNGKMDLSAAGAVMEFIGAQSAAGARAALRQLKGGLRERIEAIQQLLTRALVIIEAGIEYPEEDLEADIRRDALPLLKEAARGVEEMAGTFASGRLLLHGVSVAIVGRPNVGKSSLFNMLVGRERAIVTTIPGTTRDTVDDCIVRDGVLLRLIDTAGMRSEADEVEKIGIERARSAAQDADAVLIVVDRSAGITEEDRRIFEALGREALVVLNKADLPAKTSIEEARQAFGCDAVEASAKTGQGREEILARIHVPEAGDADDVVVTSERHHAILKAAATSLKSAMDAFDTADLDCVTIDIKEAWDRLGEITGVTATEEIINSIFDTFCLGK